MKAEEFYTGQFMHMDSMHDSYVSEIKIENNCLIIIYDKLDENGLLACDGTSYYKNKKLTIKYEFETYCDAIVYYSKNKLMHLDMTENNKMFNKLAENCIFCSFKYSVDSFGELKLEFSIEKTVDGKHRKYKYRYLEIELDAKKITYVWE